ncbi:MAG TPA: pyridoxine 5'-phosphate synthase, partial [Vicinamibacterales bacterium]|nr:pyridoxine 5'-phosphate synthase [Vicinamibacterales bacterium]
EGDPRPELLDLVDEIRPHQCTLVPVAPGEVTSQAGWQPGPGTDRLPDVIRRLQAIDVRVSLFVDATPDAIRWAASTGARRVELYTEPFARAFERGPDAGRESFAVYADAARLAHSLGLGINAGHDLDLANLTIFRDLPWLDEVSIGHAIMSRALFVGLSTVVREYLQVLGGV